MEEGGGVSKCLQPDLHSNLPSGAWSRAVDSTKSPSGQVTTDAPSPSLMREEPSQLIYHDKIFQRITLSIGGQGPVVLSVDTSTYCGWEEAGLGRGQTFSTSLLLNRKLNPIPDREWLLYGLGLKLSDHHTRKHCIPCLLPGPEVTTQKVDPQLQDRKIILGTFCLFGEAHQFVAFILSSEDSGGKMSIAWA